MASYKLSFDTMNLPLKLYGLFSLLFIVQQNNCYAQLSYNELPDTLYQEYEDIAYEEGVIRTPSYIRYEKIPAKWKSSHMSISTKVYYEDCNDCVYEEYIDTIEIRPGYDEYIQSSEVKNKTSTELVMEAEWAWVKMYEEIPKNHTVCLDLAGIDTCLWKYEIVQEAVYRTLTTRTSNPSLDTIKISPQRIAIKKYRLKNKSIQEIEKLTRKWDQDFVSIKVHTIEEATKMRLVDSGGVIGKRTTYRKHLIKAVTPLNYSTTQSKPSENLLDSYQEDKR